MASPVATRTDRFPELRQRAVTMHRAHLPGRLIERTIAREFGVNLSRSIVRVWAEAGEHRPTSLRVVQLTDEQEEAIAESTAAKRAELAKLPRKCGTCLGVSRGDLCRWCGASR